MLKFSVKILFFKHYFGPHIYEKRKDPEPDPDANLCLMYSAPYPEPTPDPTPFFSDHHMHIFFSLKHFNFMLKFCVKILFCKHYFSPFNIFKKKGKDPDPYPNL
jgi:hypothetical protein